MIQMNKERIIIIDAYNLFIRNYIVNPKLSKSGAPFGGCFGFLSSLQKLSREINPNNIVVVWDGQGGSKRKRKMFSEYKDGRKPTKLNRNINQGLSESEEAENKVFQLQKLIEYLNEMPIIQLIADDVEADDIIARVCNLRSFQNKLKFIISSDKDFIQLCNEEVLLVRPVQKEILNVKRIIEKFDIHPNNFALARAIAGDKSDNLEGIGGAQLKTISKRFSFLKEEKTCAIGGLFDFCEQNKDSNIKIYSNVLLNKEKIILNYKMMQLYVPNISPQTSKKIKDVVDEFEPNFNKTSIIKKMLSDGITDYNWEQLFQVFGLICSNNKKFKTN